VRVKMDVFYFSPGAEMLIDDSNHISHRCS
jgi:hypothetical protein